MNEEEFGEVRRLVLAFEDAATWCEQLAALARDSITMQQKRAESAETMAGQLVIIERHLLYLEAHRRAVALIRTRVGLPAAAPTDAPT